MPAEPYRSVPGVASKGSAGSGQAPVPGAEPPRGGPLGDCPPRTRGDAFAWLLIGAVGFVGGQLVALVVVALVAALLGQLHQLSHLTSMAVPPGWVVVSELAGLWSGFVAAVVLASRLRGSGKVARDMGLAIRPWDLAVGPVVGVACQLLLVPLLYLPLEPLVPHLQQRLSGPANHLTGGFPGADLAVIGVLTVLVVPVVEELLFRGLVLRACLRVLGSWGRRLGPALAIVSTGVLFGLAHAEMLELLGLAVFGMVLAWLAYRTRRLGPGILAHGAFNLVAVVAVANGGPAVLWLHH
jgi:hypothetical protein